MNEKEETKILSERDLRIAISRAQSNMQYAKKVGANVQEVHDKILDSLHSLDNKNEKLGRDNLIAAQLKLTEVVYPLSRWKKIIYFVNIYGLPSLYYAFFLMFLFFYAIWKYQDRDLISTSQLTIPLWSLWAAGIGSTVQILFGACTDLKHYGKVDRYKRSWFASLPFISLGLGFSMYLILQSGLLALDSDIKESPKYLQMLICFLAGYATDWTREKLSKVSEYL